MKHKLNIILIYWEFKVQAAVYIELIPIDKIHNVKCKTSWKCGLSSTLIWKKKDGTVNQTVIKMIRLLNIFIEQQIDAA